MLHAIGGRRRVNHMSEFHESVFAMGSTDRAYVDGDLFHYNEGEGSERVVTLMVSQGDEALTLTFDAWHLAELRKALVRAERWIREVKS